MVGIIIKESSDNREGDHRIIEKGLQSSDPNDRRQASLAQNRIVREGGKTRSMREALIKAHRDNNKREIADIHDFVEHHREYQNDY
jgi:hypothetical protein